MKPFFSASTLASAATVARIETLEAKIYSDGSGDDMPPVSRREQARLEASLKFLNRRKNDQAQRALARMRNPRTGVSAPATVVVSVAPRPARRHVAGVRSSAASGDGNSSDDPDPDPERPLQPLQLLNQSTLAVAFCVSKKTIQNQYSRPPWLLPPAIQIPGARGPRWTPQAVQAWLADRPSHTVKPAPKAAKNKVGRPRIALAVQGGAA